MKYQDERVNQIIEELKNQPMKSVVLAIQPYYVFLIIARIMGWDVPQEKTIEVRKDFPTAPAWDKVAHIYCSKNMQSFNQIPKQYQPLMEKFLGKVIGEFVCDRIDKYRGRLTTYAETPYKGKYITPEELAKTCLTIGELNDYIKCKNGYFGNSYFWHISDLKIYDKPKGPSEFRRNGEYCNDCKYLDKDMKACNKYGEYLVHNELLYWHYRCDKCLDENCKITRPPQSFCYVEV